MTGAAVAAVVDGDWIHSVLGIGGSGFALFLMLAMFRPTGVRLDLHGIVIQAAAGTIELAWGEVEDVAVVPAAWPSPKRVGLWMRDRETVANQLAQPGGLVRGAMARSFRTSPASSRGDLGLNRWSADRSVDELYELIERYRAAAQRR